jgi:O-antigen/teichoic acid export membrane protein
VSQVQASIIQSFISKNIASILNLFLIIIIARTLTPAALGLYAIASASILIVAEIKSFGISGILIRKKEIDENDIRTAIGVTIIISWGLGILVAFSASLIQDFYDIEGIAGLLYILTGSFFLTPYTSIGIALFQRNFLFKSITIITLVSQIIKFISTLLLLYFGYSYYSIAFGLLLCGLVEMLLIVYLSPPQMSYIPKFTNMGSFFRFGTFATFGNLFRRICITIPDLIIGKVGTLSQVAFFSRSIGMLDFISSILIQGIRPVATPYLSKANRESANVEDAYNKLTLLTGSILLPALTIAAVASYPLILLMFGNTWIASADVATILGIWMFFKSIHLFMPSILLTLEHEKVFFFKELFITIMSGMAIYIGMQQGLIGAAIGFTIVGIVDFITSALVLKIVCKFRFRNFLYTNYSNFIISIFALITTYSINFFMPFESTSLWLTVPSIVGINFLVWFSYLLIFSHPLYFELESIYKNSKNNKSTR